MQAALCYARHVAATQTSEAESDAVDEQEDPLQQAAAEGLTLQRAPGNITGWKSVYRNGNRFSARVGRKRYLGTFATAEQVTHGSVRFAHVRVEIARLTACDRHMRGS